MRINIICVLFLFAACASCIKTEPPLTQDEVTAVINKFDEAWKSKSLATVDSVLAPAYVYFTQSGGIFNRGDLVKTAGSPEYTLDTVARTEFYVQLFENTAVVSTRWKGKGMYRGIYFDEDQRCSVTIVKTHGKVQILSEHCTPIRLGKRLH